MIEDNPLIQERLRKLEAIKKLGINPYPGRFSRTHSSKQALEETEKTKPTVEVAQKAKAAVKIAGRIMTLREHGHLTFAQLQDQEGHIQICWMKEYTPVDQFEFVKLLDLGDFVGLTGVLFMTHKGEPTLLIKDCQLLSKSLRPLPDKWHGLKDQEACYRERYLDLVMNPETRQRFLFRSKLVQKLREFYDQHGFVELETPVLENISSGANAKPFVTHHNALDIDAYLRIAAGELWQKVAMVGGFEKTFEVARVFRNEGVDPSHLQEFTMVEHYAAYWDFEDNMKFTEQMFEWLLKEILGTTQVTIKDPEGKEKKIDFKAPWPRVNFYDLIKKDSGIDATKFKNVEELRVAIKAKKIQIEDIDKLGFGSLVDHLYKKVSRPKLTGPMFVIHHPVEMKPLARKNDENPTLCDTFQLLVNGWEVVNAYSEIVDPLDQRARFEEQAGAKAKGDEEAMSFNEEYLRAMEHGMPPTSGWGMGVDRLVTLLTQQDNLKDVVLFPLMRPQGHAYNVVPAQAGTHPPQADVSTGMTGGIRLTDDQKNIKTGLSHATAQQLFDTHVKNQAIRNHSLESQAVMRALAKRFGADEEAWGILGLLHDIDWDPEKGGAEVHGIHSEKILRDAGMGEAAIGVIQSHVFGLKGHHHPFENKVRTQFIEHALAAGETVTGLVHAGVLVRPDKKIAGMEVSSLKKKFKDKTFARGVDRNVLREAEKLGLTMDEFLELALNAMKGVAEKVGL